MQDPNDRPSPYHQAINLIIRSARLHHQGIEKQFGDTGLHRSQRMMLMHLSRRDIVPSQRELADHFNISPACVARTLKALASEGYISRACDEEDQRRNHVFITDKGLDIVQTTKDSFEQFDRTVFDGFSMEEIAQLTALLDRVHANLQRSCEPSQK